MTTTTNPYPSVPLAAGAKAISDWGTKVPTFAISAITDPCAGEHFEPCGHTALA